MEQRIADLLLTKIAGEVKLAKQIQEMEYLLLPDTRPSFFDPEFVNASQYSVGPDFPQNPQVGDIFMKTDGDEFFVYYRDDVTDRWVSVRKP